MNKKLSLGFLSTCTLLSILYTHTANYCCDKSYVYGKTHFSQRPQGNNQATVFIGTVDKTHLLNNDVNYFNINVVLGYRQSFESCDLGKYFFTEKGPLIVGIANTNIDVQNLQLGLASNFKGTAMLNPKINESFADFDIFVGLDKWYQGLWGRIRLPFVHTKWSPCLRTANNETGAATYPDAFATTSGTTINVVYRRLEDALCDGSRIGQIPALEAGRINCNKKRYGLSGIHFELGYDFFRREHGNLGFAIIGTVPTGQPNVRNCNTYLFMPSIGSQRSWQAGAAIRGQYELFNQHDNNKRITLYGDLRAVHLFSGCNKRLLSLCAGGTSAFNYWLMLNRYNDRGTYLGMERAANVLNKKVNVSAAAMAEFTLMAQMLKNNWDVSFGYNFWYRSQERICPCNKPLGNGSDFYAIKVTCGDIGWGTNIYNKTDSNIAKHGDDQEASLTILRQYAFLSGDVDVCVAQHPKTWSNMFFGTIAYNFSKTWLKPYIALAGQAEFGRGNTALSMWSIYVKGGISF